ncbi:MAG: peptidoglycan DD-metalloendopeptidase family protein [bacterium]|nr:peptidoglycan DD-metalloendopeptidase family protein [bacterium]
MPPVSDMPTPIIRHPKRSSAYWAHRVSVGVALSVLFLGIPHVHAAERATEVKEIFDLNKQIDAKSNLLEDIQRKIDQYRATIRREQGAARSLQQRLQVLDDRIAKQRLEIERAQTEGEQVALEIRATSLALVEARTTIDRRAGLLAGLLMELRAMDAQPQLHIVLASNSIGTYYAHRNQIAQLQGNLGRIIADVRVQREALEANERALEERNAELAALNERLRDEHTAFNEEQRAKEQLLDRTRNNEQRYQQLVEDLKAEVAAIDTEIVALENAVRTKLEKIDENFGALGRVAFSWPVPNRGITAYFHDPDYPYRHIFEHPAVDIRAGQGSTIVAPAPGYVAKTKDSGLGYSYVMLVHPGGFSTVYGHVSCFKVQEGTYVDRGDPIACVGGRPGTRGAGSLTSGAHLHFEIRLNGIPVNPLNYLL